MNRASQQNYDPVKGDFFLELSSMNLHLFTLEYLYCVTNMESAMFQVRNVMLKDCDIFTFLSSKLKHRNSVKQLYSKNKLKKICHDVSCLYYFALSLKDYLSLTLYTLCLPLI